MRWAALTILTVCSFNLRAQMWEAFGGGMDLSVRCLYADTATNMLYAGGNFIYADGKQVWCIAVWDGVKWDSLGSGIPPGLPVFSITKYNGDIYAGGGFGTVNGSPATGIAKWDGSSWTDVAGSANSSVLGLYEYNAELYASGWFDTIGGIYAHKIARWNGINWSQLDGTGFGSGVLGAMVEYQGNLYVGGNFSAPNGRNEIAMWDGSSWSDLDGGIKGDSWLNTVAVYNGELYVGGYFFKADGNAGEHIMKWDGSNWSDVGGSMTGGQVKGMAVWNGELYVGGTFSYAGGVYAPRIAKWNGTEWCSLRSTGAQVMNNSAIAVYDSTIVIAGGVIENGDTMNNIAKWIGGNYVDTCGAIIGVEQLSINNEQITVYPNPSEGKFTISSPDKSGSSLRYDRQGAIKKVEVYDLFGRKVKQLTIDKEQLTIDMSGFAKGMYVYVVKGEGEREIGRGKVIIE